jgi:hypothetical protein
VQVSAGRRAAAQGAGTGGRRQARACGPAMRWGSCWRPGQPCGSQRPGRPGTSAHLCVLGVEGMLCVDEARDAARLLHLGDRMQRQGRLAAALRAVDLQQGWQGRQGWAAAARQLVCARAARVRQQGLRRRQGGALKRWSEAPTSMMRPFGRPPPNARSSARQPLGKVSLQHASSSGGGQVWRGRGALSGSRAFPGTALQA